MKIFYEKIRKLTALVYIGSFLIVIIKRTGGFQRKFEIKLELSKDKSKYSLARILRFILN